jgi:thiol-disulfide isomerase/thioredoxin
MKRLFIILTPLITITMTGLSQTDTTRVAAQSQGIAFEHGLSWQEVLQKAQRENKYVFVDCYATWCGPCKRMDKNVYPIDSVGSFMNDRYISVKMQMDSTRQDNDEIRQWYAVARTFEGKYHIGAYPTFLFFSTDGQVLHKDIGGKNINDFLSMAMAALDPKQQYYTLLADYRSGKMTFALMPVLANAARRNGQDSLASQVSRYYMHHYLETLPEGEMWTRDNILFVYRYSSFVNITDNIFQQYYRNRMTIDSVMHDGDFSDALINEVLYRDEIEPQINKSLAATADEPRWHHLERRMTENYDALYAQKNILQGQINYYKAKKNWKQYIKYFIRQQEMNGIESWLGPAKSFDLNNGAYEVFKYDDNKRDLEKALSWVNRALVGADALDPQTMDTKANLLYKLGKKSEGLALEEKSHTLSPRDKDIAASYEKMKNGLPTW